MYLLDFGTNGLAPLTQLPHVADSLLLDQTEKIQKFIRIINRELDRRKKLLSEHGVGTIALYREVTGKQEPTMVILMDSYESMKDETYETDLLKLFIRNGFGIIYIITEKWMLFFFAVISSPEAAKKIPAKIAEKLYNSDWFFDALGKGP